MTTAQQIRKLKSELAAVELELDRLKSLPPVNVRRIIFQAAAAGLRGDEPTPPAGNGKSICHSRET